MVLSKEIVRPALQLAGELAVLTAPVTAFAQEQAPIVEQQAQQMIRFDGTVVSLLGIAATVLVVTPISWWVARHFYYD